MVRGNAGGGGGGRPVSYRRKVCREEGQSVESNAAERSRERRMGRWLSGFTTQRSFVTTTSTTSGADRVKA